jgi:hypothetical protein
MDVEANTGAAEESSFSHVKFYQESRTLTLLSRTLLGGVDCLFRLFLGEEDGSPCRMQAELDISGGDLGLFCGKGRSFGVLALVKVWYSVHLSVMAFWGQPATLTQPVLLEKRNHRFMQHVNKQSLLSRACSSLPT